MKDFDLLTEAMRGEEPGWRHHFAPLGIPTVVIADDPELLATARGAYAEWTAEAPAGPAIEIRLETGSTPSENVSCGIRVEGSRLTLNGGGIAGHADAASRQARCTVPRRLIGNPALLAAEVTDTLLLFLLARSGRTPVHAAGVMFGEALLVLAGPSGTGKSTLALAAARRGLRVLSDDTLYVQCEPRLRIWGFPRPIHVFPEDAPANVRATRLRGGKLKAVVPLPVGTAEVCFADKAVPILLERGERLGLVRLDSASAVAALGRLESGFDLLPNESAAAARALAGGGAWRLTLTREPEAAIEFLSQRFDDDLPVR